MPLTIPPASERRWDLVALGEVMLRLDPGEGRIHTAREFRAWEGGGEYNVARALRRVFGLRTAVVTALADNPIGRLVEDLMLEGGVDLSNVRWVPYDGVGRDVRVGLNFTERGFGLRPPLGVSDRGHTAASQLRPGQVDWDAILGKARWLHTGGIFAALSETTAAVAREAMEAAHRHGAIVSYDLNYRPSLWRPIGGQPRAREVNRSLAPLVDVMLGNEEDFTAALGFEIEAGAEKAPAGEQASNAQASSAQAPSAQASNAQARPSTLDPAGFARMIARVVETFPNLAAVATSLREATTATRNDWGGACVADGRTYVATLRRDVEILDRVGGGDAFASGLIYGFLTGRDPGEALEYAVAHGALAMTTPGDTSMATLAEVESLVRGEARRVAR